MLLNVLKILGLALSTVSAVLATLKETKTPDKTRLTSAGKTLLALGLLGFAIALGAQLKEWKDKQTAENEARERNTKLLTEIRRAVTKFETVSMDVSEALPMAEPEFARYSERVSTLVRRINQQRSSLDAGQVAFGLEVISRTVDHISLFSAVPGSLAFPEKNDGVASWYYIATTKPHIALFKKPFRFEDFDAFDEQRPDSDFADLLLIPRPGKESLIFDPDEDGTVSSGGYAQTGMEVPAATWAPSGSILSVEDLSEVTAVIYLPFAADAVRKVWTSNPPQITLYFGNRRFLIKPTDLKLQKGHGGISIFLYKFPKQDAPEVVR